MVCVVGNDAGVVERGRLKPCWLSKASWVQTPLVANFSFLIRAGVRGEGADRWWRRGGSRVGRRWMVWVRSVRRGRAACRRTWRD